MQSNTRQVLPVSFNDETLLQLMALGIPVASQLADLKRQLLPIKVYAFEWTECVYESGYSIISLHQSKRSAYRAMKKEIHRRWYNARSEGQLGKWLMSYPLRFCAWRVRELEVEK